MKKISLWWICFLIVLVYSTTLYGQVTSHGQLPAEITNILDIKYPGWKIGTMSNSWSKLAKQSKITIRHIVSGDFDGDGSKDYAVHITSRGKWYVILFLKRESGYAEYLLCNGTVDPNDNIYLDLYKKGEKGFDFEKGKDFFFPRDSVAIGHYEKAQTAFIYRNGRFYEVTTAD